MAEPVLILKTPISISLSDDKKSYVFSGPNAATLHKKFTSDYNIKFVKPLSNGKFLITISDISAFLVKNRDPLVYAIGQVAETAVKGQNVFDD